MDIRKPHPCPHCHYTFYFRSFLRHHLRLNHSDVPQDPETLRPPSLDSYDIIESYQFEDEEAGPSTRAIPIGTAPTGALPTAVPVEVEVAGPRIPLVPTGAVPTVAVPSEVQVDYDAFLCPYCYFPCLKWFILKHHLKREHGFILPDSEPVRPRLTDSYDLIASNPFEVEEAPPFTGAIPTGAVPTAVSVEVEEARPNIPIVPIGAISTGAVPPEMPVDYDAFVCPYCYLPCYKWFRFKHHLRRDHGYVLTDPEPVRLPSTEIFNSQACNQFWEAGPSVERVPTGALTTGAIPTAVSVEVEKAGPSTRMVPTRAVPTVAVPPEVIAEVALDDGSRGFKYPGYPPSTKSNSSLLGHLLTHTDETPCKCNYCGYFTNSSSRYTHGVPLKSCKRCDYKTTSDRCLKSHKRTHSNVKRFKCEICSYEANHKCNLTTHIRTHTREKPYHCEKCPYSCANSTGLKQHVKNRHTKFEQEGVQSASSNNDSNRPEGTHEERSDGGGIA